MKIFKSILFISQISAQKKIITKAKLRKWEKAVAARKAEKNLERTDPLSEVMLPEIPPESDIEYELAETFDYSPEKLTEEPVPDYSAFWYGDISPEIDVEGIPDEYEMFNDIGLQRTMDEVGISADEFDEIVEKQFLDELDDRTVELDKKKSALSSRMQQQFEVAKKDEKTESNIVNNLLRSKKKLTPKEKKALAEKRAERKKKKELKETAKGKKQTKTTISRTTTSTTVISTSSTTTTTTTTSPTTQTRRKRPKGKPTKRPIPTKKTTTTTTTTTTTSTSTTTNTTTKPTTMSKTATKTMTSTTSSISTPSKSASMNRESFMLSKREIPNSDDLFCWKCTAQNLEHCNKSGTAQKCPHDQRICGIELRKRDGRIVGVQMGCQSSSSCEANKKQNFIHPYKRLTQCRPEWFMPYSVCRQCCSSNWCNRGNDPLETPYWFKPVDRYEWEMIRD